MVYLVPEFMLCALGCVGLILACLHSRRGAVLYAVEGGLCCLVGAAIAGVLAWTASAGQDVAAYVPAYIANTFVFDPFSRAFSAIALLVCGLVFLMSTEYVSGRLKDRQPEFLALIALAALGMSCLAAAHDLLTLWFSMELVSVTGYVLAAFLKDEDASVEAALKYFVLGATASAFMLFGLSYIYGLAGTLDLAQLGYVINGANPGPLLPAAVLLMLVGFGFKVAMVPFHMWCPDVYEGAPTPVTAFLSVGPKLAGFAALVRVLLVAFPDDPARPAWQATLGSLALVTMTVGNVVALRQTNIKRMLAYSSIAHAGYLLVAVLVAGRSEYGVPGLVVYALAYVFMNLAAFGVVVAFSNVTRDDAVQAYDGLALRSPFLAVSWVIAALSLVGIPPTGGFLGKVYILMAAWDAGQRVLAVAIIVNSMISLYYYFDIARRMYMRRPTTEEPLRVGRGVGLAIGLAVAGTLLMIALAYPIAVSVNAASVIAGG